jgi:hypothetical protein
MKLCRIYSRILLVLPRVSSKLTLNVFRRASEFLLLSFFVSNEATILAQVSNFHVSEHVVRFVSFAGGGSGG